MKRNSSCLVVNEMVFSFCAKYVTVWNFALFTTGSNKTTIFSYYKMLLMGMPVCPGFLSCLKLVWLLEVNYSKPVLTEDMYFL